jgi:hypothetical protein
VSFINYFDWETPYDELLFSVIGFCSPDGVGMPFNFTAVAAVNSTYTYTLPTAMGELRFAFNDTSKGVYMSMIVATNGVGSVSFRYTASDGELTSRTATVTITNSAASEAAAGGGGGGVVIIAAVVAILLIVIIVVVIIVVRRKRLQGKAKPEAPWKELESARVTNVTNFPLWALDTDAVQQTSTAMDDMMWLEKDVVQSGKNGNLNALVAETAVDRYTSLDDRTDESGVSAVTHALYTHAHRAEAHTTVTDTNLALSEEQRLELENPLFVSYEETAGSAFSQVHRAHLPARDFMSTSNTLRITEGHAKTAVGEAGPATEESSM